MRSSAAERTRPTFWDALVVLAVLAAAGSLLFLFRPRSGNFLTARIVLDHELVAEIELTALTGPVTLEVPGAPYPITVEAEPGASGSPTAAAPTRTASISAGSPAPAGRSYACPTALSSRSPGAMRLRSTV